MIVIVTGSRDWDWTEYGTLEMWMNYVWVKEQDQFDIIVHGDCKGADQLVKRYARERGIQVKAFPADWALGNKAGPIRNQQMIDWANEKALQPREDVESSWTEVICIAFPLPQSKGTWDCIRRCERAKIRTYVWGHE